MNTKTLAAVATLVLLAGACTRQDPAATDAAAVAAAGAAMPGATTTTARAGVPVTPAALRGLLPAARDHISQAAALPDHGELLAYPGQVSRRTGAYTWHRAAISEAHALAAIATGQLRLTTPDGRLLDLRYDRHVQHPSGDWTWIGHLAGHEGVQTVLTIGADAVFGSIGQDIGLPLRMTMRDGVTWLVETDAAMVAQIDNAATRPLRPDFHVPLQPRIAPRAAAAAPAGRVASATATAGSTVDLLVGYTNGLRAAYGSTSAAQTRINNLVDTTNTAYVNGGVASRVRLVHAMEVTYRDDSDNQEALEELSGYESGVGPTTPDPAFDAIRAARETYGADLVVLLRDFRDPENDGCGIAWLLGGALQGLGAGEGWDTLGYSVVSDGSDQNEDDGKSYFCRETTFAHELGHNMGAAHDMVTAQGGDGSLDSPGDYGAFTYSFGYKTGAAAGNFYTVMAYGDSGQTGYTVFSTPDRDFCGGRACGLADADNARTLNATMPVVAGFRATVVPGEPTEIVPSDFNGDGTSDVLWRNLVDGRNRVWRSAESSNDQDLDDLDLAWRAVAVGDFNADGVADIYWRNLSNGSNAIWSSGNSLTQLPTQDIGNQDWHVVGAGDFNGDGEDDILWRNFDTGANTIWHSANQSSRKTLTAITDTNWEVVGVGDFDADGEADIFWRHSGTGKNTVWYSGDRANRVTLRRVGDTAWIVAGVGDFNGDGNDDVLWRNVDDGRNTIWRSANGSTKQAVTRVAGTSWQVAAIGDYDGDDRSDIFWRNGANGDNVLWPSADRSERDVLPSFPLDWTVVP